MNTPSLYRMWITYSVLLGIVAITGIALAQGQNPDAKCLICHAKSDLSRIESDGHKHSLFVDSSAIRASVHGKWSCNDCHAAVTTIPHAPGVPRVECTRCHFAGNRMGAPESLIYDQYKESVHGLAAAAGNQKAPHCQNCHGTHEIRRLTDTLSTMSRNSVAKTCGSCHVHEFTDYRVSVHGSAVEKGNKDAPVCTNCHGEHDIRAHSDPTSKVNSANIPNTCSACHASEALMEQYGVKGVQVETYDESYHGIAVKFGQKQAANCASCHGVHDILPANDPRSRVNVANIPHTCGGCHPGANANYARGRIHVDAENKDAGIIYYIASFFKYLTIGTLAVLILNIILDLRRKLTSRKPHK